MGYLATLPTSPQLHLIYTSVPCDDRHTRKQMSICHALLQARSHDRPTGGASTNICVATHCIHRSIYIYIYICIYIRRPQRGTRLRRPFVQSSYPCYLVSVYVQCPVSPVFRPVLCPVLCPLSSVLCPLFSVLCPLSSVLCCQSWFLVSH